MAQRLSASASSLLLEWLKNGAEAKASELRAAGWEEDGRGLWSKGTHHNLHILDAHALLRRGHD